MYALGVIGLTILLHYRRKHDIVQYNILIGTRELRTKLLMKSYLQTQASLIFGEHLREHLLYKHLCLKSLLIISFQISFKKQPLISINNLRKERSSNRTPKYQLGPIQK